MGHNVRVPKAEEEEKVSAELHERARAVCRPAYTHQLFLALPLVLEYCFGKKEEQINGAITMCSRVHHAKEATITSAYSSSLYKCNCRPRRDDNSLMYARVASRYRDISYRIDSTKKNGRGGGWWQRTRLTRRVNGNGGFIRNLEF